MALFRSSATRIADAHNLGIEHLELCKDLAQYRPEVLGRHPLDIAADNLDPKTLLDLDREESSAAALIAAVRGEGTSYERHICTYSIYDAARKSGATRHLSRAAGVAAAHDVMLLCADGLETGEAAWAPQMPPGDWVRKIGVKRLHHIADDLQDYYFRAGALALHISSIGYIPAEGSLKRYFEDESKRSAQALIELLPDARKQRATDPPALRALEIWESGARTVLQS